MAVMRVWWDAPKWYAGEGEEMSTVGKWRTTRARAQMRPPTTTATTTTTTTTIGTKAHTEPCTRSDFPQSVLIVRACWRALSSFRYGIQCITLTQPFGDVGSIERTIWRSGTGTGSHANRPHRTLMQALDIHAINCHRHACTYAQTTRTPRTTLHKLHHIKRANCGFC